MISSDQPFRLPTAWSAPPAVALREEVEHWKEQLQHLKRDLNIVLAALDNDSQQAARAEGSSDREDRGPRWDGPWAGFELGIDEAGLVAIAQENPDDIHQQVGLREIHARLQRLHRVVIDRCAELDATPERNYAESKPSRDHGRNPD